MKLIIQILCYDENKTLPLTLSELPRAFPGFDGVEPIRSPILSAISLAAGALIFILGLVADLVGGSRKLAESALIKIKELELGEAAGRDRTDGERPC